MNIWHLLAVNRI